MDAISIILIGFIVFCAVKLCAKPIKSLAQYAAAKGRAERIQGTIIRVEEAGTRKVKGKEIYEFFPVYSFEIKGTKIIYHSFVKHVGDSKGVAGQEITMLYDEKTGTVWCERELPIMKKMIIACAAFSVVLVGTLIAVDFAAATGAVR